MGFEYMDFVFTSRTIENLRRVFSSDIFDSTSILTDTQPKLAETLVFLCYMPPNILRNILRSYRCNHIIHSVIRGCAIVFVSINRLNYLLRIN